MTTRYPREHAAVAVTGMSAYDRESLKEGDEVIVSIKYGAYRLRETVTKRTDHQVTLTNGSRYSLRTGKKIGTAESYDAPTIMGIPRHTVEDAERQAAAIVQAAREAEQAAELGEILDRIEALASRRGEPMSRVILDLQGLNHQRAYDAVRARGRCLGCGQGEDTAGTLTKDDIDGGYYCATCTRHENED